MDNRFSIRKFFPQETFRWKKVLQYFLQGILIIGPLTITIYAMYWIVTTVDAWLPIFRTPVKDVNGNIIRYEVKNYGLGFLIIIGSIITIGYLSSFFIQTRIFNLFDRWLEKTPGIKFIYTSTRDFFEAFAGNKKKFNKAVLANAFAEDVWIVGFLTDEEMEKFDMGADKVAVYVPQAYNFAGQLYILPRDKVRKIEQISSGEAMKYAVTGGVVDLDDDDTKKQG
ncbi:MAG: DUF502 domain-containing protein [Bacteroidetes bacterium]|nr:DUF502 domain-containing protein [Bacteroidota bacterium]